MVHLRLNETEVNPNPHVNFITALPSIPEIQEESRQLLRALAAQVKPIMKSHGFVVNSLEEYEYNQVFAGRNWNHGETVELVLRRPGGEFYPTSWLMSTLCHELAHIKHMNHGPGFQALWKLLRLEVRQLQERGYYGDGEGNSLGGAEDEGKGKGKRAASNRAREERALAAERRVQALLGGKEASYYILPSTFIELHSAQQQAPGRSKKRHLRKMMVQRIPKMA
ncbi:hypothetical protein EST38_g4815 [Candolleomyces aberdarensis]|uniref:WLM domain-containing protein n=1 Tax=Candolleomyces aberdarensis TaxID=2316362 RepID=A0A4Q2DQB2_9AGAR|nr:hypothetical protein EST38_g4815 [Candolleomyces aberdarensis]